MADVDITSLSVEISAESQGAELNIDKLATAISNLRTKGNVAKVIDGLDKLTNSLTALKSAQGDFSGLEKVTQFIEGISKVNAGESAKSINTLARSIQKIPDALSGMSDFSDALDSLRDVTDSFNSLSTIQAPKGLSSTINALKKIPDTMSGMDSVSSDLAQTKAVLASFNTLPAVTVPDGLTKMVNTLRRIPTVIAETNKADYASLADNIRNVMNALAPLSLLDVSGLKGLGSAFTALGKVPDLTEKLKAADLDAFATACEKISTSLTHLASQLDKVGNAFAKLPPQLSEVVTQANRVTAANEKQRKSYLSLSNQMNSFMRNMAKLVSLKAIATYLGNAVAKFNDFYEATDLFHNAMGGLSDEADSLISKMQDLLGVDPTNAMTYMATIQSLGTSFGLASDKAYILSKNLTQLAYDEASYWNKDVSETFTAMSSAISGEIEPIRRLGIDLSQARLQQELLALGFNKQVSSLSQADKAVLRYIAIMKQTTNIQGNLAQTINSPANQIKILKAQLDMLAKSVGSLLYPALKSILPPLIAAVQLIREFVEWVAKLMGVNVVFTDFSNASSSVGDISDAMDDTAASTNKAAKALKDYTMGFDELNIIDPTQGSSGSSGSSGATGNILGDVDLSGYDMFKDYVGTSVDEIKAKLESMKGVIAAIGVALAGLAMTKFLSDVSAAIAKMTDLQKLALSIATVVIEAALVFQFSKDYASTGNPLALLGEVVSAAFGSFVLWKTIGADGISLGMGVAFVASLAGLTYALATNSANLGNPSTWIQAALTTAFGSIAGVTLLKNLGVATGAAATLSIGLVGLITFAGITFSVGEKLKDFPVLDNIIAALMGIFGGVAGAGVALLVGASLPVAGAVAAAGVGIGLVLHWAGIKWGKKDGGEETDASKEANEKMSALEQVFEQKIESIKQIIVTKWNQAMDFLGGLASKVGETVTSIGNWFAELPSKIGNAVSSARDKFVEWASGLITTAQSEIPNVISAVTNFFSELPGKIGYAIGFAAGKIVSWAAELVTTVTTEVPKIVDKAVEFFTSLPGKIADAISATAQKIIDWTSSMIEKVTTEVPKIVDKVVEFFSGLPDKIWNAITGAYQKVADWASSMKAKVEEVVPEIISSFMGFFESIPQKLEDLGTYIWQGLTNGLKNAWETAKDTVKGFADGVAQGFRDALGIHSPSTVFAEIGDFLMQGLVQGVENAENYVNTAFNIMGLQAIDAASKGLGLDTGAFNTMGQLAAGQTAEGMSEQVPSVGGFFNSAATYFGTNFWTGLDDTWTKIDKSIQTDAIGSVQTLYNAIKNGNLETVATWAASYFYHNLSTEQKTQIQTFAQSALLKLSTSLSGVFTNLSGLASGFVGMFVPAATTATASQTALNVAMDANPIMLVISLIGMLVGALINFAGTNTDVGTSFKKVWLNVKIFFSYIVEGIVGLVAVMIQGFVSQINAAIWVYNKAVGLFGGKQVNYIQNPATAAIDSIKKQRDEWKNELANLKNEKDRITGNTDDYDSKYQELLKQQEEQVAALKKQLENSTSGLDSTSLDSAYRDQIDALKKQLESLKNSMSATNNSSTTPSWNSNSSSGSSASSGSSYNPSYPSHTPSYNPSNYNPSDYPGTKDWQNSNSSSSGSYGSSTSVNVNINEAEMRESVYNGTYNAFLDIFQRYGDELTGGKELKIYLDGKQITASVEKRQNARGQSLMGSEVYSY